MARRRADIAALNHIAQILIDATRLYARAARLSTDRDATARIERTIGERAALLDDIRQCVRDWGGRPRDDGSMIGAAQLVFLNVRALVDSNLESALAEIERGERMLREEIRKAMRRDELHAETRAFLGVALDRIVSGEMRIEGKLEEVRAEHEPLHH